MPVLGAYNAWVFRYECNSPTSDNSSHVGCYRPHPPSPFIIITYPEIIYSFVPQRVEGWLDLGSTVRVCSQCLRLYITVAVVINTVPMVRFKPRSCHITLIYDTTRPLWPAEAHGCEQRAQGFYLTVLWPGFELMTIKLQVHCPNHLTTEHPCAKAAQISIVMCRAYVLCNLFTVYIALPFSTAFLLCHVIYSLSPWCM